MFGTEDLLRARLEEAVRLGGSPSVLVVPFLPCHARSPLEPAVSALERALAVGQKHVVDPASEQSK